jgi:hypothetical protein
MSSNDGHTTRLNGAAKITLCVFILLLSVWSCGFSSSFTGNSGESLSVVEIGGRVCSEFDSLFPFGKGTGMGPAFDLSPSKRVVRLVTADNFDAYYIASYRRIPGKKKCVALQLIERDPNPISSMISSKLVDKWFDAETRASKKYPAAYKKNRGLATWEEFCGTETAYKDSVLCATPP